MSSIALLQARTNSSRLPGKVLLPINNIPLVVLAAKRAANTGCNVIVATSKKTSDDALTQILDSYNIPYYRGSLENPLERLVSALEKYSDDKLVFRLTADNVFPDGELLDEIEADFISRNLDYLCCNGKNSGLPYGMSVELTRLGHLRESLKNARSSYDQEHVTPYIRRKFGVVYFEKYKELCKEHYRCTVDCLDDYLSIQQVFSDIKDPVHVSSLSLIDRLENLRYQPLEPSLTNKLVLGTAQLGLSYGIANNTGKPHQETAEQLLKTAISNGVTYIDTARAYGNSEEVIGRVLNCGWEGRANIITKLSPLNECPMYSNSEVVNAFVDASIFQSSTYLRIQSLDVVMLHRVAHVTEFKCAVWNRLLEHKANGTIKSLGISVQNPEELEAILNLADVSFIQMPFNLLDWRWDKVISKIIKEKEKRELKIHVRSALLQGLLISGSPEHWKKANVEKPEKIINWLKEQADLNNKSSIAAYCLSYVKSFEWIDGVVVGMETNAQLRENIKIFCEPELSKQAIASVLKSRPFVDSKTLNPACWSK